MVSHFLEKKGLRKYARERTRGTAKEGRMRVRRGKWERGGPRSTTEKSAENIGREWSSNISGLDPTLREVLRRRKKGGLDSPMCVAELERRKGHHCRIRVGLFRGG